MTGIIMIVGAMQSVVLIVLISLALNKTFPNIKEHIYMAIGINIITLINLIYGVVK